MNRCSYCESYVMNKDLLRAANPFNKLKKIIGCPSCYSINSMMVICQSLTCKKEAVMGYLTEHGYHLNCYQHIGK